MIKHIAIDNFETHVSTSIELHAGVNVIIGESDEGKSGIIRALKWNAQNRPQGDEYRNDKLDPKNKKDKKVETSVSVIYSKGNVDRVRNGVVSGVNHYTIDLGEPLRALRSDVPTEVQEVSQMKPVNIQGQHPTEQYFLLADKPGQVAKEFNKVSGLTIMDKATSDINSQVRTCNAEIGLAKKEIEKRETEITKTDWIDKAKKLADKLKTYKTKVVIKQDKYNYLKAKTNHVLEIKKVVETHFKGLDTALSIISDLTKENKVIHDKKYSIEALSDLVLSIKSYDTTLSVTVDIDKALSVLKSLNSETSNIVIKEKEIDNIRSLITKLKVNKAKVTISENALNETQEQYDTIRTDQECPVCGRKG